MNISVAQILPAMDAGGVERGTLEVAKELVKRGHRSIVISAGGRLVDGLIGSGSEHIQLDVGRKSLLSLRHIPKLRRFFREENINIIHARSRLPAWLSYLAWTDMDVASRPGFITTVHGAYRVNRYSKIMTKGEKVIATSAFINDYIINNYPDVDHRKITIIHRGTSSTEFPFGYQPDERWLQCWCRQYPAMKDKFLLTLPARLTRRKGHEDFLTILSHLKKQDIPIHGLVAGGYHPRKKAFFEELEQNVRSLGLENEITFLGHRSDIREIMSVSDIVFSLSKEPESFGRTALEALCLGVPVIGYNHGGTAEIMAKMYPYGCVNPEDTAAVCDKIIAMYKKPVPVADKNFFTLEKMLDKTISLYTEVASS